MFVWKAFNVFVSTHCERLFGFPERVLAQDRSHDELGVLLSVFLNQVLTTLVIATLVQVPVRIQDGRRGAILQE